MKNISEPITRAYHEFDGWGGTDLMEWMVCIHTWMDLGKHGMWNEMENMMKSITYQY